MCVRVGCVCVCGVCVCARGVCVAMWSAQHLRTQINNKAKHACSDLLSIYHLYACSVAWFSCLIFALARV